MFIKRLIAIFISTALLMIGGSLSAAPAYAHVTYCEKRVYAPERYGVRNRIAGSAYIQCPRDGHHTYVSLDAWIEVYAPNGSGGYNWRRTGQVWEDDDKWTCVAKPNTGLLPSKNTYRTRAQFRVYGPQGTRRYDIKTSGKPFTRS